MRISVFLAVALFAHCVSATPTGSYSYDYEEESEAGEPFLGLETTTPDPTMEYPQDYPRNPPPEGPIPPPKYPKSEAKTVEETSDTNDSEQVLSDPTARSETPSFEATDYSNPDDDYYATSDLPWLTAPEEYEEPEEMSYDPLNQLGNNVLDDATPLPAPPTLRFEDNPEYKDILPEMPILKADLEAEILADMRAELEANTVPGLKFAEMISDMRSEMEANVVHSPSFADDNPPPVVTLDECCDDKMDDEFKQALKAYISIQVAMARNASPAKIRKMFLLEGWITIGFNNSADPQKPVALAVIPVADEDLQAQFYPTMMEELREADSEDEDKQESELKDLGLLKA